MWRCDKSHITIMKIMTNDDGERTYITAVGDDGIAVTNSYDNDAADWQKEEAYNDTIQECENKNS